MDQNKLIEKVKQIISQEVKINVDSIELDTELSTLDIDSLDMLKVAVALEKSFAITISTVELTEITTFGNIMERLASKIALQPQASSINNKKHTKG